jgi:hypothetical protein
MSGMKMKTIDLIEQAKKDYDLKFEVTDDIVKLVNLARSIGYSKVEIDKNKDLKHEAANCLCVISGSIDVIDKSNLTIKQNKVLDVIMKASLKCIDAFKLMK